MDDDDHRPTGGPGNRIVDHVANAVTVRRLHETPPPTPAVEEAPASGGVEPPGAGPLRRVVRYLPFSSQSLVLRRLLPD